MQETSWIAAVVNLSLTCHNEPCKAPIYSAACPGAPPDAGLQMARAHPPEARVITYFCPLLAFALLASLKLIDQSLKLLIVSQYKSHFEF